MNLSATLRLMQDPQAKVSAHFLIPRNEEEGIIQMVDVEKKAWHSGRAIFQKLKNVNLFSVGIQLVGTDDSGYTDWQYEASSIVCNHILNYNPKIAYNGIVGHDTISERGHGPGKLWKWDLFFDSLVRKMYNLNIERY